MHACIYKNIVSKSNNLRNDLNFITLLSNLYVIFKKVRKKSVLNSSVKVAYILL